MGKIIIPRRKLLLAAGASLIASPAIVRAQMTLTGAGGTRIDAATFTPASLPGIIVWLKADAGVSLSVSAVTQWTDQISSIAFTPVATGFGPVFSSTSFNSSHPGITGTNGVTTGLQSGTSAVSFGASNQTATFACVINISAAAANASALLPFLATGASGNENSDANSVNIRFLSAPSMQVVHASGGFTNDSMTTGTNFRFLWEFDGTNETSYFNNVQQSQSALNFNFGASGSGNGGLCIFSLNGDGTNSLTATIAEVVITKTAISSTNRTNLDNYFRAKWGL